MYFSESGNTECVAKTIEEIENSDIKEIVTKESYSKNHDKLIELGKEKVEHEDKPTIESIGISDHEFIYLEFQNGGMQ